MYIRYQGIYGCALKKIIIEEIVPQFHFYLRVLWSLFFFAIV